MADPASAPIGLATATAAAGSTAIPNQRSYEFDQVGNITRAGTAPNAARGSATHSGAFGGAYSQAFAYSGNDGKIGNLTSKAGVSQTYSAPAPATGCVTGTPATKPHAAASAGSDTYSYDCTGNTLAPARKCWCV